jgi:hypothetical protein
VIAHEFDGRPEIGQPAIVFRRGALSWAIRRGLLECAVPIRATIVAAVLAGGALAYGGPNGLATEMVDAHNAVPFDLGLPPVTWDVELARDAQNWADRLIAERGLRNSPRETRPCEGKNLPRIDGGHTTATDLFAGWAREAEAYA